jgi:hypothetical protein
LARRVWEGPALEDLPPPEILGVLVLDAFSSGAIPVHLLTREDVQPYLSKLTADGGSPTTFSDVFSVFSGSRSLIRPGVRE